eukprot:4310701-Prymnesium_polylepis.2
MGCSMTYLGLGTFQDVPAEASTSQRPTLPCGSTARAAASAASRAEQKADACSSLSVSSPRCLRSMSSRT